jgi:hypothetical protein
VHCFSIATPLRIRVAKVQRTLTTRDDSPLFCVEVAASAPATTEMFELGINDTPDAESAQPLLDAPRPPATLVAYRRA